MFRNAGYLLHRPEEPRIAALFLALIDLYDINMFWDVGANIGYYTWLAASAKPHLRVVAIEPDTTNFSLLSHTRARYAPHVTVVNAAVSSHDGQKPFLLDNVSGATGTLEANAVTFNQHNYGEHAAIQIVQTRSLDSLAVEHGRPDLIKIDVENHEMAVLSGGQSLLDTLPIIMIEAFGDEPGAITVLRNKGYLVVDADTLSNERAPDGNYLALAQPALNHLETLKKRLRRSV